MTVRTVLGIGRRAESRREADRAKTDPEPSFAKAR